MNIECFNATDTGSNFEPMSEYNVGAMILSKTSTCGSFRSGIMYVSSGWFGRALDNENFCLVIAPLLINKFIAASFDLLSAFDNQYL